MTGGTMHLAAIGIEDLFLTSEPQVTFFKIVYRRHTNFSIEEIKQKFIQISDFGTKVTAPISRNGDLVEKMTLVITLPKINKFDDNIICEDQLFGYFLNNEPIKVKNINLISEFTQQHCLQVTKRWFSIHPIHTNLYTRLIGLTVDEQQKVLEEHNLINYKSRLLYFIDLQKDIKEVVERFFNKNKQIGLG